MKYIQILFYSIISLCLSAQSPQLINYQGLVRDGQGMPIANKSMSLKFEILQGSASGPVVYTEFQDAGIITNALGLFNTQIGKNAQLGTVNWATGPHFLHVYVDPTGGNSYISLGAQQIASVPYALSTPPPSLTYSSNVLSVNGSTVQITQTANTFTGGTNVTITGGPDYTLSATPSLAIIGNSLSISGGNEIQLPEPSITGSGLATVSPTTGTTFNVDVPSPSYNANTGVLSFGTNTTTIVPALVLNSGVLTSGPASNSAIIPAGVTVAGSGIVNVSGFPNYTVSATQPSLQLSPNNVSLSITGGNTVLLPAAFPQGTVTESGIVSVTSAGTNSFNVNVPLPTYAPSTGVLSFGLQTTNVIPALNLTGTNLSVGPSSNFVNLATAFPWTRTTNAVTLTTATDRVGIGASASPPSAKLDIQGETTLTVPVVKVNNLNAASSAAALDVTSAGNLAMSVTNNNPGGVGGSFSSASGIALTANNNSSFYTFQATNTNGLSTSYAGYFDGGFVAKGKGGATNMIVSARNASAADVFVVRNDGNVGIGTNAPTQKLDVAGSVKITDGTEGLGKVLSSDGFGNASWQPIAATTTSAFGTRYLASVGTTQTNFGTSLATFTKTNTFTRVQVTVQTHLLVQDLNGLNAILFEVKLGNTSPADNTGRTNYFIDNNGAASTSAYIPVTIIAEFAAGLTSGTYNVNVAVSGSGGGGTGSDIYLDPGNFGASSVIIKEYR
jgi:hypothetical protein